jgi:ribosome-associated protein
LTESTSVARARVAAEAAAEKKGTDLTILDVGDVLSIIELFVLVSASNVRQVRTIVDEVERAIAEHDGSKPNAVEGLADASWVLLDYGDLVVHVFLDETRAYYDLDRLWGDVPRLWPERPGAVGAESGKVDPGVPVSQAAT